MTKRKNKEDIERFLKNNHPGSKLLSLKCENYKTYLKIICENGHIYDTSWNNIYNGSWCYECYNRKKKTLSDIKEFINENHAGARLISKKYKHNKEKLHLICEHGYDFKISWNQMSKGYWCNCFSKNKKITIERINNYIDGYHSGSKLKSKEYNNNNDKLFLVCEKCHNFSMSARNIFAGHWCPTCKKNKKKSLLEINNFIEKNHYGSELTSKTYKNNKQKLNLVCEYGHEFKLSWDHMSRGCWCKFCKKNKGQNKLKIVLEDIFNVKFHENVKMPWLYNNKTKRILELDIYREIGDIKIAFEYQGYQHFTFPNRYHKTKKQFLKQQKRDKLKRELCEKNNVILIEIKEFKNIVNKEILKSIFENVIKYKELCNLIKFT
jgi:hypothetical protein